MTNSSLLRCAAAFTVLSVYIWLFGITGVIEDYAAVPVFADESPEFEPSEASDSAEEMPVGLLNEPLSATNINVNPANEPKPGLVDFSAQTFPVNNPVSIPAAPVTTGETPPEITQEQTPTIPTPTPATPTPTITTTVPTPTPPAPTPESIPAPPTPEPTPTPIVQPPAQNTDTQPAQNLTVTTSSGVITDSALNIVSRIVQLEIGSSFDVEAIKAHAVATYSFIMYHNAKGVNARVLIAPMASDRVTENVRAVLGQAVYYGDSYAQTLYGASSAGFTSSAQNVWGAHYPYLISQRTDFDKEHDPNYGLTAHFSSTDIRIAVLEKTGINLTGDPSAWLQVLGHVDTVYVGDMTVGGHTSYTANDGREIRFTGKTFRDIMGTQTLRSAAFEHSYSTAEDRFTFVTYGYGHGAGLSQNGANILAKHHGYDYKQILAFYFPGTTLR